AEEGDQLRGNLRQRRRARQIGGVDPGQPLDLEGQVAAGVDERREGVEDPTEPELDRRDLDDLLGPDLGPGHLEVERDERLVQTKPSAFGDQPSGDDGEARSLSRRWPHSGLVREPAHYTRLGERIAKRAETPRTPRRE